MRKKLLLKILLASLGVLIIIIFVYCIANRYTCEIPNEDYISMFVSEDKVGTNYHFKIGDSTYNAQYLYSRESYEFECVFDSYGIAGESPDSSEGKILVKSETGEMVGFDNINAFPKIENISLLSDDEIKEKVETIMGDFVDFTQYNTFNVTRINGKNPHYSACWQVKRDILCYIHTTIDIAEDGTITGFTKRDNCPPDITESFVTVEQRNKLFEKTITDDYLQRDWFYDYEFEIESETLMYYDNKPAIWYSVLVHEGGFKYLLNLVIYDEWATVRQGMG